jgi:hypothetical protein
MGDTYNIVGLLVLVADVYAIVMIVQSSVRDIEKLIWSLVIFLLPALGLIAWLLAGPWKKPFRPE